MKVSDLVDCRIAVNCLTKSEAIRLLSIISKAGYNWVGGGTLIDDDRWEKNGVHMCYWLTKNGLYFGSEGYFRTDGYIIIDSRKFVGINILHINYEGK
jgi:hypothetical protein